MRRFLTLILTLVLCGNACAEPTNAPLEQVVITSTYGAGFFAEVLNVLNALLCSPKALFYIDWSEEFFPYKNDPYENGWDLYFEPIRFSDKVSNNKKDTIEPLYHEIHDYSCIDHWVNYKQYLQYRLKVNEVIKTRIEIRDHISAKIDKIVSEKMSGYYCIGVHVRYGSDHGSEAPQGIASLQDYIMEVKNVMRQYGRNHVRVYLATDSHYVIKEFQKTFPSEILLTIDTFRTEYQDVPHLIYGNGDYWLTHKEEFHKKKPGYLGGEGVLMDALLLANCNIFIHSTSNIASFVTFYNPYIKSIYLPKSQKTWPCRFGK